MRCFLAIELDDVIKAQLGLAQSYFKDLAGKVSWVKPQQIHLTVKFLGEVPEEKIDQAARILQQCAGEVSPFEFSIEGLGAFPPSGRQIRVLWVGMTTPAELVKLNDLCQEAFVELGCPAERRKFTPHLTIARVRQTEQADAFRRIIAEHKDFTAGTQYADHVVLYSSQLNPSGAIHTPLATVPLTGK